MFLLQASTPTAEVLDAVSVVQYAQWMGHGFIEPVKVGAVIMDFRKEARLGRAELAHRAGISYPYLSEIENGKKKPAYEVLSRLAAALGVEPTKLFGLALADTRPPDQLEDPTTALSTGAAPAPGAGPPPILSRARRKLKNRLDFRVDQLDDKSLELLIELAERLRRPER